MQTANTIYKYRGHSKTFYRQFFIKKKNGRHRRICAPSPELLAFQRSELHTLAQLFSTRNMFLFGPHDRDIFHGFLKDRNIVTCAEKHIGFDHTICLDISNCFDSITNTMLNMDLDPRLFHQDGSLAQGFSTSPILANIYLTAPVSKLLPKIRQIAPEVVVTVYADDLHISLNNASYQKLNLIIKLAIIEFANHHLTINPRKTRIRHAKFGNRRILGIMVDDTLKPSRKLKKKIRAARFQRNGPSLGGLVTASRCLKPRALRVES